MLKILKLSDILISHMLNITVSKSNMKFQVFKKVAKFTKLKKHTEKELYKSMYEEE